MTLLSYPMTAHDDLNLIDLPSSDSMAAFFFIHGR